MKHKKDWYKDLVIYQIYPRSFKDGNNDGIGDLKGMIEKLDYLKELGINAVWMSPVYASPNVDNGYDISDYFAIMEEFGTMEDWDAFRDGAHERGIAIIMDLVLNHSSDKHVWFQESKKSRNNPYSDYYIWRDPAPDGGAPNCWMSVFGGSAWEYVPERGQYYLHFFAKEQPDLNWDNPETKEKIFDIIRFWNEKGVDGYRIDAISYLDKGLDGRADMNEPIGTVACVNLEGTHRYIREMVAETMTPDNLMSVGEVNINNEQDAINYSSAASKEFNMAIPFVPPIVEIQTWSPEKMKRDLKKDYEILKKDGWWARFLSNHDKPRQVSLYGNDREFWSESAKMLACYLHTLPGTPFVFQGEELGMTNVAFPSIDDYNDIDTRNYYKTMIEHEAYLHPEAMESLLQAQKFLKEIRPDYSLIVYDAARPMSVQQKMWNVVKGTPKYIYVSNPARGGGLHNYGLAVDISIIDAQGQPLPMGTPVDYLGKEAHITGEEQLVQANKITKQEMKNRRLLRKVMREAGFRPLPSEWWHFNRVNRQTAKEKYPIIP